MASYIFRRLFYMVISLGALSVVAFVIIQLPPGDYISTFVQQMEFRGIVVDEAMMRSLFDRFAFTS